MHRLRNLLRWFAVLAILASSAHGDEIAVRHIEGVTLGFLVLRTLDGNAVAYGDVKQRVEKGKVRTDMRFHFRDGSFYQEDTVYTQNRNFRVLSDHVVQRGASFKDQLESWVDTESGDVTVHYQEKGREKQTTKRLNVPADAANGIIFVLLKNLDPSAPKTTLSMVVATSSPRIVKLNVFPEAEKTAQVGLLTYKAQHYRIHVEIGGVAGVVAPIVGKQPPDMHAWLIKSEAPTFLEFEGPLESTGTIWRMELAAPEPDRSASPDK
jgi:hypothetical protein